MNPHPLRVIHFQIFRLFFDLLLLNLLHVQSHQAEIIIVKYFIQGSNNMSVRVGVETRSRNHNHMIAVKMVL